MRWVLRLIASGDDARCRSTDLAEICRPDGLHDIADLGLTLSFWQVSNEQSSLDRPTATGCCGRIANRAAGDAKLRIGGRIILRRRSAK